MCHPRSESTACVGDADALRHHGHNVCGVCGVCLPVFVTVSAYGCYVYVTHLGRRKVLLQRRVAQQGPDVGGLAVGRTRPVVFGPRPVTVIKIIKVMRVIRATGGYS